MKKWGLIVCAVTLLVSAPQNARANDNCGDVQRELESRFWVVRFGPTCQHHDPATADVAGAAACAAVLAAGGAVNESGTEP